MFTCKHTHIYCNTDTLMHFIHDLTCYSSILVFDITAKKNFHSVIKCFSHESAVGQMFDCGSELKQGSVSSTPL